jgi:endonuclease/exonuclease/phosphatase (EEP) superfamily protein YafD
VAFTPFAIPLYAAALALVVGVFVARRAVTRPSAVAAVAAAAGLLLHAWWFAPMFIGETPEPAAAGEPVVVMTANLLRGYGDGAQLVEQAREHDVDLLVVSEITVSSLAAMKAAGLDDLLPYAEGLPGPDGEVPGTMLFSAERTRLVDTLDTISGGLVVETGGFTVVAAHPSSPVYPEEWQDDQQVVVDAVEEHAPDLVVGDFNATLDHWPLRDIVDLGYRDSVELSNGGFQATWPVNGTFGALGFLGPVAQIDHVLVGEDWTATDTATTELDGTDHKPVVAVVARR